jgi:hypothetical protein
MNAEEAADCSVTGEPPFSSTQTIEINSTPAES